jgi:hypothetical protein
MPPQPFNGGQKLIHFSKHCVISVADELDTNHHKCGHQCSVTSTAIPEAFQQFHKNKASDLFTEQDTICGY